MTQSLKTATQAATGGQPQPDSTAVPESRQELLQSVWEEAAPQLARLVGAMGIGQGRREDVLQDVYLAVWRKCPAEAGPAELRRWLFRVAFKARIAACNKILEYEPGKTVQHARFEQVETLKTTAEIELMALEARRAAIATIVRNGEQRWALLEKKYGALAAREPNLRAVTVSGRDQTIAALTKWVRAWQACPIEQGRVTIRPIKWELTAPPTGGGTH